MCEDTKGEVVCCRYDPTKTEKENCESCQELHQSGIAGSYRRR